MNRLIFAVILIAGLVGCKKNEKVNYQPASHEFKGIVVINDFGEMEGTWGTEDGDWDHDQNWTAAEHELLNFPDTINMSDTYVKDTIGWNNGTGIHEQPHNAVLVFPNPVGESFSFLGRSYLAWGGYGLLKFKATIVDKDFNRLFTYAGKASHGLIYVDLTDSTRYQSGTIYRIYYSLSAKDSLDFYKGHGDILICRQSNLQDCRQYVP